MPWTPRGLLDNPHAEDLLNSTDRGTGIQRCKWNGDSRTRREDHFALNTAMPLPEGTADKFVLISVAELESLRRKVELHEAKRLWASKNTFCNGKIQKIFLILFFHPKTLLQPRGIGRICLG
jgi:hypothetical protein